MNQSEHIQDAKLAVSEAALSVKSALSILSGAQRIHGDNLVEETRLILAEMSEDLKGGLMLTDSYLTGEY